MPTGSCKRKPLSVEDKVKVIREIKNGKKKCDVGRNFDLVSSTVHTIWKNRDKLTKAFEQNGSKIKRLRKPERSDVDKALLKWYKQKRSFNVPLSGPLLMAKAEELSRLFGDEKFVCSYGWIDRFKLRHNIKLKKQQYPAPVITDVDQPVTVSDTDQVVTGEGSNNDRQNSILSFDATEVCVSDISQGVQTFSEVDQPTPSVKQTDILSHISPLKRPSRPMRKRRRWRELAGSFVGDQELGLITDRDSMAANSKVTKFDANVMPHAVIQEARVFPQSTISATQKEKRTLVVPNHQVAVMSNLLSMWKAGRLCDSYISNGSTNIMIHKMVLGAVCPKVLPILHSTSSSSFPKVTFPSSISQEGLLAFAEYMYTGVLDLTQHILVQLKTIAQRLDMKDFEQLCINELHKAKAASILSVVVEPLLEEPCSLSGLLPSSTRRTPDPGASQNTSLSPLLKLLESIYSSKSSNSQGAVPTDNLVTVGDFFSSSSSHIVRSAPVTTTADQVINIKTELESDNETILTQNSQQLKMEPISPVRNRYGIQEELLIDFENIASNTGLQLAPSGGSSSTGRGDGLPISYSTNHYGGHSSLSSPEVIHIDLRHSEDDQLPGSNRGRADSSNDTGDGGDLQLVPITSVTDHCTIPSDMKVTASVDSLVSYSSDLVNIPSNMATNRDLSPTASNSVPYPVVLFAADGSKITSALQGNCA